MITRLLLLFWLADIAFVDRADIKAYVGPPTLQARYEILRSCVQELLRTRVLKNIQVIPSSRGFNSSSAILVDAKWGVEQASCTWLIE